jgi:hypothetical protein
MTAREGAGFIDLEQADQAQLFTRPTALSFGLLRRGGSAVRSISVTDAGGGAGPWTVSVLPQIAASGVTFSAPPSLTVPGSLSLRTTAGGSTPEGTITGFVFLNRSGAVRRIPFWLRVTAPRITKQPARLLARPGVYSGNTRGRKALVSEYRYPDNPSGAGVARVLAGPEEVFRVRLRRPAANLGVALISRTRVQPRILLARDENRLAGSTALPLNTNPYLPTFFEVVPVSAVIAPAAGTYYVVFDSPRRRDAGRFSFRLWINDSARPRVRLLTPKVQRRGSLVFAASDSGAGVDPRAVFIRIDRGGLFRARYAAGRVRIPVGSLAPGRHTATLQVSDHQESKNMENVPRILPNTTTRVVSFVVR